MFRQDKYILVLLILNICCLLKGYCGLYLIAVELRGLTVLKRGFEMEKLIRISLY